MEVGDEGVEEGGAGGLDGGEFAAGPFHGDEDAVGIRGELRRKWGDVRVHVAVDVCEERGNLLGQHL